MLTRRIFTPPIIPALWPCRVLSHGMLYTVVDSAGNYIKSFNYRREALSYIELLERWNESRTGGEVVDMWTLDEEGVCGR